MRAPPGAYSQPAWEGGVAERLLGKEPGVTWSTVVSTLAHWSFQNSRTFTNVPVLPNKTQIHTPALNNPSPPALPNIYVCPIPRVPSLSPAHCAHPSLHAYAILRLSSECTSSHFLHVLKGGAHIFLLQAAFPVYPTHTNNLP